MVFSGCGQKPENTENEPEQIQYTEKMLLEIYSPILNSVEYEYYALLDVNQDEIPELFVTDMIYSEDEPIAYWADLYAIENEEPIQIYEELIADYMGLSYDNENNWIMCNTRMGDVPYPDYYEMISVNSEFEISSDVLELETYEDEEGNIKESQYFNGVDVTDEETEEYTEYLTKKENANEELIHFTQIEKECAVEIAIEWDGTYPDSGEIFNLDVEMEGTMDDGSEIVLNEESDVCYSAEEKLVATYDESYSDDKGMITIRIYDTNGTFSLEGSDGDFDPAEFKNEISYANAVATVTTSEDTVTLDLESGMIRSYTGVWFWGICGIDHGAVAEYDASWVEEGYKSMEGKAEEKEPEKTTSTTSVESRVAEIKKIYNNIQNSLSSCEVEDGGDGTTRYVKNGKIIKIVTSPETYRSLDFETVYTAEYYYEDDTVVFVYVHYEDEAYRFYISEDEYTECVRYIDTDGRVEDYPEGVSAEEVSWLGRYCTLAMQELHWAGVI